MLRNATSGFWNCVCEAVVKSARRVPTAITRSASSASRLAARLPFGPIAPAFQAWFQGSAPFPGLGLADGDAQAVGEVGQSGRRFGVEHPAAGNDQRLLRIADHLDRALQILGGGTTREMWCTRFSKKFAG